MYTPWRMLCSAKPPHDRLSPVKLSILMPVYNELATLRSAVKEVLSVQYPCEIELVIVDDGSTDGTRDLYAEIESEPQVTVFLQPQNAGKGAAVRKAAELAAGDYVIICDADLEYRPAEIPSLLLPVLNKEATVVYGTRTFGSHNSYSYLYVLGNRGVTTAANILFNCYISDLETCFKLMPTELYRSLNIRSAGFGMEAEITGKILRKGVRPYEVPITYRARSREEGKKLTWRDGVEAIVILVRERYRRKAA
jgi:glycosyltransferase involved in cell wall biosynthesis